MERKQTLLLPGPTPVPPTVLRAMSTPMIDHRGPEFKQILDELVSDLKKLFQTTNEIVILTTSGTGGMEAAVTNFLSPGDKALVVNIGNFGDRFAEICAVYDVETEVLAYEWGKAARAEDIAERLDRDKEGEIKAVLVQQNETSTAVLNDIEAISKARGNHPALMIVDAVSGLAAADLQTDAWGVDVVISGSQKAFMVPPGLAAISVSPRAWEVAARCRNRRYYFDLLKAREFAAKGQTPFTPAESVFFGLREAVRMLLAEGLDKSFARHCLYRDMVRAGVRAIGLELPVADAVASPVVTAVKTPEGLAPGSIRSMLLERFGVVAAVGQGRWINSTFRIGHLGNIEPTELLSAMAALEMVLASHGVAVSPGSGVAAAAAVLGDYLVRNQ